MCDRTKTTVHLLIIIRPESFWEKHKAHFSNAIIKVNGGSLCRLYVLFLGWSSIDNDGWNKEISGYDWTSSAIRRDLPFRLWRMAWFEIGISRYHLTCLHFIHLDIGEMDMERNRMDEKARGLQKSNYKWIDSNVHQKRRRGDCSAFRYPSKNLNEISINDEWCTETNTECSTWRIGCNICSGESIR